MNQFIRHFSQIISFLSIYAPPPQYLHYRLIKQQSVDKTTTDKTGHRHIGP